MFCRDSCTEKEANASIHEPVGCMEALAAAASAAAAAATYRVCMYVLLLLLLAAAADDDDAPRQPLRIVNRSRPSFNFR